MSQNIASFVDIQNAVLSFHKEHPSIGQVDIMKVLGDLGEVQSWQIDWCSAILNDAWEVILCGPFPWYKNSEIRTGITSYLELVLLSDKQITAADQTTPQ